MDYYTRDIKFILPGFDAAPPTFREVFLDRYHGGLGHPGEFKEQGLLGAVGQAEAFNALPEAERTPEARNKILEELEDAMNSSLRSVVNKILRDDTWDEDFYLAAADIMKLHNVTEVSVDRTKILVEFHHDNQDGDFLDNDLADNAIREVREILNKHGLGMCVLEADPAEENRDAGQGFFPDGFSLSYSRPF